MNSTISPARRAAIDRQTVMNVVRLTLRDNPSMPMPGGNKETWVAILEESLDRGASAEVLCYAVSAWHHQYKTIDDLNGRPVLGTWLGIVRNRTEGT